MARGVVAGRLTGFDDGQLAAKGLSLGLITNEEHDLLQHALVLRRCAIMVDDFPIDLGHCEITRSTQAVSSDQLARDKDGGGIC